MLTVRVAVRVAALPILEAGEEPTDLSPTPLAGLHGGPGFHPDQD
ncbi:hypothetical protein [Streptomyces sp. NPDC002205]